MDFVGYGTAANCFEGAGPTAPTSNTTAALRKADGATDTDNNNADFVIGAPNPRAAHDSAPRVASTFPAASADGRPVLGEPDDHLQRARRRHRWLVLDQLCDQR